MLKTIKRWFIGPHEEIRRPVNNVDHSLLERMEERRRELERRGIEPKAVRRK